jgi:hypothetical protein
MNGDAPLNLAGAPVRGGQGAESVSGGISGSAPEPSAALMERHRAAMHVIQTEVTSVDERYALLEAVVWPSEAIEEMQRKEAA